MPTLGIARSFLPALLRLEPREQSLTMGFLQKFVEEHIRTGLRLERVNRSKISNLWSARITQELRAILYQEGDTYLVLHVDHHDAAYAWAERRQLYREEASNRLQIVETLEHRVEVEVPVGVPVPLSLFAGYEDSYLLSLGVPVEWVPAVRAVRDADQLLSVCMSLPEEVAESLLDVADGKVVTPPHPTATPTMLHADAGRRYYIVQGQDELARALEGSLEAWMLFLHPDQRQIVEGVFSGPAQVRGAAGTGKTVVALHRARELARREAKVLLATFTRALADNLSRSLDRLCTPSERSRIEVSTLHRQALRLSQFVRPDLAPLSDADLVPLLREASQALGSSQSTALALSEWHGVIRPGGITEWSAYRDVSRVGRGQPLSIRERHEIWRVIAKARDLAWPRKRLDWAGICGVARRALEEGRVANPFHAVLVDEVQDFGTAELQLVRALSRETPGHLMLFGDAGQRIYGRHSDLAPAQIDVAGRVFELRTNYRTTDAICRAAEALRGLVPDEASRSRSLLRGPEPVLREAATTEDEVAFVLGELDRWRAQGIRPDEVAVVARVEDRLTPLREALVSSGVATCALLDDVGANIRIGTIHGAKGLEFKAVAIIGCEDETIPYRYAVESHTDPLDREVQLRQERHLLYVGMTRAREELTISWVGMPSRWLTPSDTSGAVKA